jgi:hypothetical protein
MAESSLGRWEAVAQMAPKQQRFGPEKDRSSEHKSLNPKTSRGIGQSTRRL